MGDNNRAEIERLRIVVQQLLDEKAAEKAAKEEQERKNRKIVPVMHMSNDGSALTILEGTRVDANNFELRMPLYKGWNSIRLQEEPPRTPTAILQSSWGDTTPPGRPMARSMTRRLGISTFIQRTMLEESMKDEEHETRIVLKNEGWEHSLGRVNSGATKHPAGCEALEAQRHNQDTRPGIITNTRPGVSSKAEGSQEGPPDRVIVERQNHPAG